MPREETPDDVFFETTYVGNAARVAAIHAATGTEVVVMGPAHAAKQDLERLALRKLKARLEAEARR